MLEEKGQKPYDFTHKWNIKQKRNMKRTDGWWESELDKEGLMYGDWWNLDSVSML